MPTVGPFRASDDVRITTSIQDIIFGIQVPSHLLDLNIKVISTFSTMSLASLPDEVLKLVLHHVPLNDRISSCCLVNQRLHAAALAATQQVVLGHYTELLSNQREDCFRAWMEPYGQNLTRLQLRCFSEPLQQLACPNLLHLQLWKCSVQLGPAADGHPGVIQGCTKLIYLDVSCRVIDVPEGAVLAPALDSLSSLVHLQHLHVLAWDVQYDSYQPLVGLSINTLPRLTKLTSLEVHNLSFENLAQLGGLTNLQELYLPGAADDICVGPISVPGMVLPASLTKLALRLPVEAGILSVAPAELKDLQLCGSGPRSCVVQGPAEGPGSLFAYLSGLKHLVRLWLDLEDCWPPAGPAYSAVTASSNLVSLYMSQNYMSQNKLPQGVWPHVFPASRTLLHLTSLSLVDYPDAFSGLPATWTAEDLCCLVGCCPNLCELSGATVEHGRHVSNLGKLTGLASVGVMYADGGKDVLQDSMGWLATVTQLQDLTVTLEDQDVSVACLLALTSLTGLNKLSCNFQDEFDEKEWLCDLKTQVRRPALVCLRKALI